MATFQFSAQRIVLAGGFALAVAAAPAIAAFTIPSTGAVAQCANGESEDPFVGTCVPDLVPNSPEPFNSVAGNPDLPEVNGIPCTGGNSGQCIGLGEEAQSAGPQVVPHSSVSSSP